MNLTCQFIDDYFYQIYFQFHDHNTWAYISLTLSTKSQVHRPGGPTLLEIFSGQFHMVQKQRGEITMTDELHKGTDEKAGDICGSCKKKPQHHYWCEVCERAVEEKRCPFCGLKARKIR